MDQRTEAELVAVRTKVEPERWRTLVEPKVWSDQPGLEVHGGTRGSRDKCGHGDRL